MNQEDQKPKMRLWCVVLGFVLVLVGLSGISISSYLAVDVTPFSIVEGMVAYVVMGAGAILFDWGLP
jgi:hypothetical protein